LPWTFEGQSFPLAVCNCELELAYTDWLEMRAYDKIVRRKRQLIEMGNWETHLRIWQSGVDADRYDFAGSIAWESRWNEPGQKELLYLMLNAATPGVLRSFIDRIFANHEAKRELFQVADADKGTGDGLYWRSLALGRPTSPPETTKTPAEAA